MGTRPACSCACGDASPPMAGAGTRPASTTMSTQHPLPTVADEGVKISLPSRTTGHAFLLFARLTLRTVGPSVLLPSGLVIYERGDGASGGPRLPPPSCSPPFCPLYHVSSRLPTVTISYLATLARSNLLRPESPCCSRAAPRRAAAVRRARQPQHL